VGGWHVIVVTYINFVGSICGKASNLQVFFFFKKFMAVKQLVWFRLWVFKQANYSQPVKR
jgi:hypothetical protein